MNPDRLRVVIDTGVLVSGLLQAESVPAQAFRLSAHAATLLVSEETINEAFIVLHKPKFKPYLESSDIESFMKAYANMSELVHLPVMLKACRDPDDDKFLALAVSGAADMIITGDQDLLILNPFQDISILTPRKFLDFMKKQD